MADDDGDAGFVCWLRQHDCTTPRDTSTLAIAVRQIVQVQMLHASLDIRQVKVGVSVCRQLDASVPIREALNDDVCEVSLGNTSRPRRRFGYIT